MKIIDIHSKIFEIDSIESIKDPLEIELCKKALSSIDHAYAPYSDYKVGAALLLNNNELVEGSNQENAVFPLGLCAERVAIFSSCAIFPKVPIKAIAVQTIKTLEEGQLPGFPCGSCRQVIIDMEYRHGQDIKIFILGKTKKVYMVHSAKELLPFAFDQNNLEPTLKTHNFPKMR